MPQLLGPEHTRVTCTAVAHPVMDPKAVEGTNRMAAGAAGSFIVQFARMAGARVLASVGSDAKAAVVRDLGAEAINYHEADVGGALSAACPEGLDWVVDGVGGALQDALIQHMRPGATLLQIGYISEYPHTGTPPRASPCAACVLPVPAAPRLPVSLPARLPALVLALAAAEQALVAVVHCCRRPRHRPQHR